MTKDDPATSTPRGGFGRRHFTTWSLAALLLGIGAGLLLQDSQSPAAVTLGEALRTAGRLWLTALQYTVVPLVITQALLAVLSTERIGLLGGKTFLLFGALLVGAAFFTLMIAPLLVSLYRPDPATVTALRTAVVVPESLRAALGQGTSASDWLGAWFPAGVGRMLRGAGLLPILLATLLLGALARHLPGRARTGFRRGAERVARVVMGVVGVILIFTPIGVLALSYGFARGAGLGAVGFFGVYLGMICGLMLVGTVLLYPLTVLLARIPLRDFARAAASPQLVAIGTRSSLASLPALVETGRSNLGLPEAGTGFVLPLSVAAFKLNLGISHPFMLLFLAHAFGLSLSSGTVLVFVVTILLLSFAIPGIPGGNPGVGTLPVFLAAGIPIEGPLILDAVDAIPDIFKTVLNVTGDLAAATILTRPTPSA